MNDDERFMKEALAEARTALSADEIPIGAVVVADGRIIGRGHNLTETLNDVTAHAEMQAITAASEYLGAKYLSQCALYVTVEPCVMCAGAIGWSQLGKLVYGTAKVARNPNCKIGASLIILGAMKVAEGIYQYCPIVALKEHEY